MIQRDTKMKEQTEQIRIRIPAKMHKLILEYAAFQGINKSKAIRELLMEGLIKMTGIGMLKRLQETLRDRDPKAFMEQCERCGSREKLGIQHINGNIYTVSSENQICLCRNCIRNLEKFMRKNPEERFAIWFFLD